MALQMLLTFQPVQAVVVQVEAVADIQMVLPVLLVEMAEVQ